jgi:DNA segregation ATPase FtsK/SpoIIIE, S-DNA-T family
MSGLTISQVLGARFRASKEIDELTHRLHQDLDLVSKGRLVRLALGRSLGMGALPSESTDADIRGQEVPSRAIFKDEDIEIWLGLLVAHAKAFKDTPIESMDSLRRGVRRHWERGVIALQSDWIEADENYEKFVHALVARRAYLGEGASLSNQSAIPQPIKAPPDASDIVAKALREVGIDAEVRGQPIHGPRVTRYRVYLRDVNQINSLERRLRELSLLLNVQTGSPSLAKGDEARVVFLSLPRPKDTWKPVEKDAFTSWLEQSNGKDASLLPVFLGLDELGRSFEMTLADAPHLFVAGTTGSGKSVCLHSIIASLLGRQPRGAIELALIDPKQVEFSVYEKLPNLYRGEVVYDSGNAFEMLQELVVEMESRYTIIKQRGVANWQEARATGWAVPRIVVVVEELADLLLSRKETERPLTLLAQKARAAGIHLILATQRPDAKTFVGLLRSNIPSRIALTVQKSSESTIILDEVGAEDLLGAGDMLVKPNGQAMSRVHGVFLSRNFLNSFAKGQQSRS